MLENLCKLNNIPLSKVQMEKFNTYKELIKKWGKRINITSILDDKGIEVKHFFDSIIGIKAFEKAEIELKGKEIADVGSGGGFPGIPLAIMVPEAKFYLIEPRHKRVVFLEQVKRTLNLPNVEIIGKRAEEIKNGKFEILTMRAVEDPENAVKITENFLKEGAVLCIYRGKEPFEKEIEGFSIKKVNLDLKGVNLSRHFLFIKKGDKNGSKD